MLESLLLKPSNHYWEGNYLYFLIQDQIFVYQLITCKNQVINQKVYLLACQLQLNTIWLAFYNQQERDLFQELLKIPAIGLKSAQLLVANYTYQEIMMIVKAADEAKLLALKGIGTKTARSIITTLQKTFFNLTYSAREKRLIGCLVNLGYAKTVVLQVIKELDLSKTDEECLGFLLMRMGEK